MIFSRTMTGFSQPQLVQCQQKADKHIHNEIFTAERYFLAHPDPIISKLREQSFIADRYQLE